MLPRAEDLGRPDAQLGWIGRLGHSCHGSYERENVITLFTGMNPTVA